MRKKVTTRHPSLSAFNSYKKESNSKLTAVWISVWSKWCVWMACHVVAPLTSWSDRWLLTARKRCNFCCSTRESMAFHPLSFDSVVLAILSLWHRSLSRLIASLMVHLRFFSGTSWSSTEGLEKQTIQVSQYDLPSCILRLNSNSFTLRFVSEEESGLFDSTPIAQNTWTGNE